MDPFGDFWPMTNDDKLQYMQLRYLANNTDREQPPT